MVYILFSLCLSVIIAQDTDTTQPPVSSEPPTVNVDIGYSSENKKCVVAPNVESCAADAGNKDKRVNEVGYHGYHYEDDYGDHMYGDQGEHTYHHPEEDTTFTISVEGNQVCAVRTDNPETKLAKDLAAWRIDASEDKLKVELDEAAASGDYSKAARLKAEYEGLEYARTHDAGDIANLKKELEAAVTRAEYNIAAQLQSEINALESSNPSDLQGWMMYLQISCVAKPALQGGAQTRSVFFGESVDAKKCIEAADVASCSGDAGNKGIRINSDHTDADDSFIITVEGNQVCAERTDDPAPSLKQKLAAWRIDVSEEKLKKEIAEAVAKGDYMRASQLKDDLEGLEYARSHSAGDITSLKAEMEAAAARKEFAAAANLKAEIEGLEAMQSHVGWDMQLEIQCISKPPDAIGGSATQPASDQSVAPGSAASGNLASQPSKPRPFLNSMPCTWTNVDTGYSFDLSALKTPKFYRFHSKYTNGGQIATEHASYDGFEYLVNVCANVDRGSLSADHLCENKADAPALQVTRSVEHYPQHSPACFVLGSAASSSFTLLDPERPEKGVQLTYHGGEACSKPVEIFDENGQSKHEYIEIGRTFSLNFTCDPEQGDHISDHINIAYNSVATEHATCEYSVSLPTRHACPQRSLIPRFLKRMAFVGIIFAGFAALLQAFMANSGDKDLWRRFTRSATKAE